MLKEDFPKFVTEFGCESGAILTVGDKLSSLLVDRMVGLGLTTQQLELDWVRSRANGVSGFRSVRELSRMFSLPPNPNIDLGYCVSDVYERLNDYAYNSGGRVEDFLALWFAVFGGSMIPPNNFYRVFVFLAYNAGGFLAEYQTAYRNYSRGWGPFTSSEERIQPEVLT